MKILQKIMLGDMKYGKHFKLAITIFSYEPSNTKPHQVYFSSSFTCQCVSAINIKPSVGTAAQTCFNDTPQNFAAENFSVNFCIC